jgi:SAM-dependent methyltransferase
MDRQAHWDHVYGTKSAGETSWYEPHLQTSLDWISDATSHRSASVIDVGGGESTLVDDLLARGYRSVTVLDIAEGAIKRSQDRLGVEARSVHWLVGDVTRVALPADSYDIWHDRAVFHFLTEPAQRFAYVQQLVSALKAGGDVVMATFGPEGPQRCSGLETMRYDAESLQEEMGPEFRLVRSSTVLHQTPMGTAQQFLYCHFLLDAAKKKITT